MGKLREGLPNGVYSGSMCRAGKSRGIPPDAVGHSPCGMRHTGKMEPGWGRGHVAFPDVESRTREGSGSRAFRCFGSQGRGKPVRREGSKDHEKSCRVVHHAADAVRIMGVRFRQRGIDLGTNGSCSFGHQDPGGGCLQQYGQAVRCGCHRIAVERPGGCAEKRGMLASGSTIEPSLQIHAQVLEYKKGNAVARTLLPMSGSTVLAVRAELRQGETVISTVESKRTISFGDKPLSRGMWKEIFSEVAEDVVNQLTRRT